MLSTDLAYLEEFKAKLKREFEITDLGPLNGRSHLGLHVQHDRQGKKVHLSCDEKINHMLKANAPGSVKKATTSAIPADDEGGCRS